MRQAHACADLATLSPWLAANSPEWCGDEDTFSSDIEITLWTVHGPLTRPQYGCTYSSHHLLRRMARVRSTETIVAQERAHLVWRKWAQVAGRPPGSLFSLLLVVRPPPQGPFGGSFAPLLRA